ncbi:oligopeptide/dipeptide ABC transporter ATP-binding protein [Chelativorans sp. AA-79]|uniref:oligopeptide/dipeptide ABC transporter ATP-binding protein n=1 Tax=Chelativorans sp. AA-79 TaxID=3028735 RepID=UPI0023FA0835|nr:oligopeptide/dipeptide ABC transporter ATP-binding protein [Chelativorans sp. AA-79]WEX11999.1 ATP-binding cassette domain-containing protein [Chelativorans sp. AA-79]
MLEATGLTRNFLMKRPFHRPVTVSAVSGVDLAIGRSETLAIVGESGCGKSTLGRLLLGLLPATSGSVRFEGVDLAALAASVWRRQRARMQIVFQNPLEALDPRLPVGRQIAEPLAIHGAAPGSVRKTVAERLMHEVGLAASLYERRPLELSGGQRQRVVIARALATQPAFVVFDEPVSALDVSVQAQIIALIRRLQEATRFASVFISHDLRVVRHVADRIAVMYLGRIVEEGPVKEVLRSPAHPYTRALIDAVPQIRQRSGSARQRLRGEAVSAEQAQNGCAFHSRCPLATIEACTASVPTLKALGNGRSAACHLASGTRPPLQPLV